MSVVLAAKFALNIALVF